MSDLDSFIGWNRQLRNVDNTLRSNTPRGLALTILTLLTLPSVLTVKLWASFVTVDGRVSRTHNTWKRLVPPALSVSDFGWGPMPPPYLVENTEAR